MNGYLRSGLRASFLAAVLFLGGSRGLVLADEEATVPDPIVTGATIEGGFDATPTEISSGDTFAVSGAAWPRNGLDPVFFEIYLPGELIYRSETGPHPYLGSKTVGPILVEEETWLDVTFRATNTVSGEVVSLVITVRVTVGANEPPVAVASADKTEANVGEEVVFSSSGSFDPDGEIVSWSWNFGDGWTSASPNPTHAYDEAGTYEVTLVVTDDDGLQSEPARLTITVIAPNQSPTAIISADAFAKAVGEEFAFDGSSSTDLDGEIVSGSWSFGDGGTSTEVSPKHAYSEPGTYTVTLTVTDDDGSTGQATRTVRVEPSLVVYAVAAEEQKVLVGGFDHENYKTKVYAIVEPPVAGARVEFAFAKDSGKGVEVDAVLSPASSLTDATGKAETTLTSGDLVTVIKVTATRGASSLQATVQVVGVTGAIYVGEKDITGPPGGKTGDSEIVIPVGGTREIEGRSFTGDKPLAEVAAVWHVVTAEIVNMNPQGVKVARIIQGGDYTVEADGRLNKKILVEGLQPGTFEVQLTVKYSRRTGGKTEAFKSKIITVSTVGVIIKSTFDNFWPKNGKLLATASKNLWAEGFPKNQDWLYEWAFSREANFSPNSSPKAEKTVFAAPAAPTAIELWNKEVISVLYYPPDKKADAATDERALNITAPSFFGSDQGAEPIETLTPWITSNRVRNVTLLFDEVRYDLFDQVKEAMSTGDLGDGTIFHKEDVPWQGIRNVLEWAEKVGTTPNFAALGRGAPDSFTDQLHLPNFDPTYILDPATIETRPKFNFRQTGIEVLSIRFHVWHTAVGKGKAVAADVTFTENTLSVTVDQIRDHGGWDEIRLKTTYTVKITKPK